MTTLANQNSTQPEAASFSVALPGNILSTNAQEIRAQLSKALEDPRTAAGSLAVFELDVTRAQMIDSVGLNLIVWLLKSVRERQGRLRLLVGSIHVERTLQFTRLDQQAQVVRRP